MQAIDPNSRAVLSKNTSTVIVGAVMVALIIALGWALGKTRWRTADIMSARVVEQDTDSRQAERVVDEGERILADRKSQQFDGRTSGRSNESSTGESNIRTDLESERQLQETLRRLEEERRRMNDLAKEADLSPLGQGLHQLGSRSDEHGPSDELRTEAGPNESAIGPQPSSLPNIIGGNGSETLADRRYSSTETTSDVFLGGSHFAFGQRAAGNSAAGPRPDHPNNVHRLFAGTVIPSVLLTSIDSGMNGTVRAQVTSDVRDSVTGTRILVPKGSFLLGRYETAQDVHADRLSIGWERLQFPNGVVVSPGNAVTSDLSGIYGIRGTRESRFLKTLGSAVAINLLGSLARRKDSDGDQLADAVRKATGDSAVAVSEKLLERDLNQPPSFRVSAGTEVNVTLETDLWLLAY
ncbi:MAG: TrbI/VirB10 family protein [Rhodobacteraceae bacterium]|nr:TrbI/VirB10 family protein [Paracoccaceae bacterium]